MESYRQRKGESLRLLFDFLHGVRLNSFGRERTVSFLKYWLPVFVWMTVIFSASTDVMSSEHTYRFIGPLVQWLKPQMSPEGIEQVHTSIRKGGHLTEYAILSCLILRARRKREKGEPRPWRWPDATATSLYSSLYAASDELHQTFVPSRQASVTDVLIDIAGVGLGLAILWTIERICRR